MEKTERKISRDANVKCFDRDPDWDDVMVEGFTGSNGCAILKYTDQSWDWFIGRSPDIYCIVEKVGFTNGAPPDKDNHDQRTLAKMEDVTLYRDRRGDYGHVNGCGPYWTEDLGINDVISWATRFGDECIQHDKCYWDCQIYLAFNDESKAQAFCDYEMYEGMKSMCHAKKGKFTDATQNSCLARASFIYQGLQEVGGDVYDRSSEICPSVGGINDQSMNNDYSHPQCYTKGYHCGYDGSIKDDLRRCNNCCSTARALHEGRVWDDHFCECLPSNKKCGTTLAGFRFNHCNRCCYGSKIDDGWTYDDFHCR